MSARQVTAVVIDGAIVYFRPVRAWNTPVFHVPDLTAPMLIPAVALPVGP